MTVEVAGTVLPISLWQYEQRALVLLEDEQQKISPDNVLIDFLCNSVRLSREMKIAWRSETAMPWIKVKLDDGTEQDVHVTLGDKNAEITQADIDALTELVRCMDRAKMKSVRINEPTKGN